MSFLQKSIIPRSPYRSTQNIQKWRRALQYAENIDRPRRYALYQLYRDLVLDNHLSAHIQKRTTALTSASYSLHNSDGEPDTKATQLLLTPWFDQITKLYIETKFYGHSLLQIQPKNQRIHQLDLIPREHIIPELGVCLRQFTDETGIEYRKSKVYSKWLIEIGQNDDLGLLSKAAPYILMKKFAFSAYSEYAEVHGMPIRILKTNTTDSSALSKARTMMENMSNNTGMVIDKEEELELAQGTASKGEVYVALIQLCNTEVSKLITSAVVGEDSASGSRAKEEVSERTETRVYDADKRAFAYFVNYTLLPHLIGLGYPLYGLQFKYEEQKDIQQLYNMAIGLMQNGKDVDNEFITETFGIPVVDKTHQPSEDKEQNKKEEDTDTKAQKDDNDPFV